MIEAKWSPEPWRHNNGTWIWDAEGKAHWFDVGSEDKRRIVACVNACQGIPTEALESGALGRALDAAYRLALDVDDGFTVRGGVEKAADEVWAALRALGRLK